jgi:hypothetical protein
MKPAVRSNHVLPSANMIMHILSIKVFGGRSFALTDSQDPDRVRAHWISQRRNLLGLTLHQPVSRLNTLEDWAPAIHPFLQTGTTSSTSPFPWAISRTFIVLTFAYTHGNMARKHRRWGQRLREPEGYVFGQHNTSGLHT